MLGLPIAQAGRFAEAEQAFRRASELAPRNADYLAYLGEILLLIGRDEPSRPRPSRLFRRALELEPGNRAGALLSRHDPRPGRRPSRRDRRSHRLAARRARRRALGAAGARRGHRASPRSNRIDIAGRLPAAAAPRPTDRDRRHSRPDRRADGGRARASRRASRTRWSARWSTGSPRACARIRATPRAGSG